MTYTTRKTNAGFELQVRKIASFNYARVMYGDKIAARFDSAPLETRLRDLYAAFEAFDFSDIFTNEAKQRQLSALATTRRNQYAI